MTTSKGTPAFRMLTLMFTVLISTSSLYASDRSPGICTRLSGERSAMALETRFAETAAQFWKRFVAAVKKGEKETVASSIDWSRASENYWWAGDCSTPAALKRTCGKVFTKYVKKEIARARLERAESDDEPGPAYMVNFGCAPTTYDDEGQEYGCGAMLKIARVNQEWKIVSVMVAG